MASNNTSSDNTSTDSVIKTTNEADSLAPQADDSREQGLSGSGKSAFSHAKDFEDGAATNDGPVGDVERLTAGTAATNRGDGNFMASLEAARETQEETNSTAI